MKDSLINDFEIELLSLNYIDLKLNIKNGHIARDFDWIVSQTKAFAHWAEIEPVFGKGYNIYKQQRDDFRNGLNIGYFKVITIGERHRYNDSSFLNTYANQLRDYLMITYDINANDLNRMKLFYKKIEKVHNEAVRLKECFNNSRDYILANKDKSIDYLINMNTIPLSSPTLKDWNNFERESLKKEVPTNGTGVYTTWSNDMMPELLTANNEVSYFTKDFFDDLTMLFWYRKEVLGMIIKELEPINIQKQKKQESPKGYDLGYTDTKLEIIYYKLIEGNFLDRNTKLDHFKNAFNGEPLNDFVKLKWKRQYYASIVVREYVGHDTPWQIAVQVFDNGTSNSLKNAYKHDSLLLSDNQTKAKKSLDEIFRSLP